MTSPSPPAAPRPARLFDRNTPPTIATLVSLSAVSALGMNLFLPSLPAMTAHFETEYGVMQLSVALYLLVSAALNVVVGPISDRFGRRPVIMWGVALFALASIACAFAPTAEIFLAARMAQAAIAVGMVLTRAAIRDLHSQDEAASKIGYVTMGMAVAPMIGPFIGGLLEENVGWQASFWLLAALGVACLGLTWGDFAETASTVGRPFMEQVREYPQLLSSRRFWGYAAAAGFSSGAFFSYLGGAPFVGTTVFGLSAAELGLFFGAPAIGYFAGNYLSGRHSVRIGVNRMVLWGCVLNGIGVGASWLLFRLDQGTIWSFFGFMTFVGLGNGMTIPNATSGALSVRPRLAGSASGLFGAIMIGGGAALSALAGTALKGQLKADPLLDLMLATAVAAIVASLFVILRQRQLDS